MDEITENPQKNKRIHYAKTPVSKFTPAAFFPFLASSLTQDQYVMMTTGNGLLIWQRYCPLFQEWEDTLLQKLSSDWEGGIISSSLLDTYLNAPLLMLLNYPPSSNAGKTSRSNRTSSQVIEPILGKQ